MRQVVPSDNPYAPPQFAAALDDPNAHRVATIKLYRGTGLAGIAYNLVVYPIAMYFEVAGRQPKLGPIVVMTLMCGLFISFFAAMYKVAGRLGTDLEGNYRRARWMGILVAVLLFPVFTIPGILAVRRLERYRHHEFETSHVP